MVFRWWYRFFHNPRLLWIRCIKAMFGSDGGCRSFTSRGSGGSPWNGILRMLIHLREKNIDLQSFCPFRVGDGNSTSFWQDVWLGDEPLCFIFPRFFLWIILDMILLVIGYLGDGIRILLGIFLEEEQRGSNGII